MLREIFLALAKMRVQKKLKKLLPPATESTVESRTPCTAPIHHCSLVHLRSHQIVITQLLGQTELLIGLKLCG
jgi:hypothetical protein